MSFVHKLVSAQFKGVEVHPTPAVQAAVAHAEVCAQVTGVVEHPVAVQIDVAHAVEFGQRYV